MTLKVAEETMLNHAIQRIGHKAGLSLMAALAEGK